MRSQRRSGRKRIVAPDGSELAPAKSSQPDGTLVKALARAWRWQNLLDDGVYTSVSEIAQAENLNKSYVSRILRLATLTPDLVEAVLNGYPMLLRLEQLRGPYHCYGRAAAAGRFGRDHQLRLQAEHLNVRGARRSLRWRRPPTNRP